MRTVLGRLLSRDDAQDLAEYGVALAVIVPAVAFIAAFIGTDITGLWQQAVDVLQVLVP